LNDVKELIDAGHNKLSLYDNHFSTLIRYTKALMEYKRLRTEPRTQQPSVLLFVGPSGSQKSTVIRCLLRSGFFGRFYVLPLKNSGPWFDDYDQQDSLFIDEMNGHVMRPEFFNLLNDSFECVAPVHGTGGVQILSKYHFFGSNYLPQDWWKSHKKQHKSLQIRRRIHAIWPSFRREDTPYPPRAVVNGVDTYYIVPGRGVVPVADYVHPFDERHSGYSPHYHSRTTIYRPNHCFADVPVRGTLSLCWNHLYDPVTNVCPVPSRLK
jgi:hypothetical protein